MKVARVYLRVSAKDQDLARQESIIDDTKAAGFYVAGAYREQASGARADRPELKRMIADLQPGEVVIAEKIDRISRLPLPDAEQLIAAIRDKGAKLAIPGVVDLSELAKNATGQAKIVLEVVQDMLLKLALQAAHDDYQDRRQRQRQGIDLAKKNGKYQGRAPDLEMHKRVIALREDGRSIAITAKLAKCSEAQVKRIWQAHSTKGQQAKCVDVSIWMSLPRNWPGCSSCLRSLTCCPAIISRPPNRWGRFESAQRAVNG